ncbi:prepilin-type N-terminal cleavage/methylation domain-containing protein [Synechococcus sp. AH-551-J03]|nr:prepilin-type N-terminal cleavage/methylation domain-containing protein [Synechococcus sp. AH-551-J03]
MSKQYQPDKNKNKGSSGFSLTEGIIATAILGTLASVAYPSYISANKDARQSEAKATLLAIPPIISAFVDETGEKPTTWDDLSSIAVVMTSSGPATGKLTKPITLPNSGYILTVLNPINSTYTLTAKNWINEETNEPEKSESNISQDDEIKDRYAIKSCFNISNGASDLKSGILSDIEDKLNCG